MLSRIFRDDVENIHANRKRQIDTLKIFNDNVTEIKEDAEYKVDFTAGDVPMCLNVTLPLDFPKEKPRIKVQPPVTHSWVNNNTDIDNAPGLLNFTVHSDLGRVVQVIIREFQIRPPNILGHSSTTSQDKMMATMPPVTPHYSIPELSVKTQEELQRLNENADELEEFIVSLSVYQERNKLVDARIAEVEMSAHENLGKQEKLERLRRKVLKRVEEAKKLKSSFDDKNKEFEKSSQKYQPQNIQEVLRLATIKSDEESEIIADKFLNREIDVEQFLVEYIDKRKLSQIRKTKEEKLSNQLKELQRAGY